MDGGKLMNKNKAMLIIICILFMFVCGATYKLLKVTEIIPTVEVEEDEQVE